jgi:dTDP-4-amino-4,6-dideoxygalactose transaminase
LANRIMILRSHGMTKEAAERYSGHYKHWDMIECGWKYNMDNIQASLLLPQLSEIDKLWQKREKKYLTYSNKIMRIKEIKIPEIPEKSKSAFHLFTIWVNPAKRDKILWGLGNLGIGAAVNYRAIHLLKYFREEFKFKRGTFPVAEKIGDSTISLPFYPKIKDKEIDYVIESLKRMIKM